MSTYSSTMDTQFGPFTAIVDDTGSVLAAGWTAAVDDLLPLVHTTLRERPGPRPDLGPVSQAVRAYHDGDLAAVDAIPVRQEGGGVFLPAAWKAMREITPSTTVSYTELAGRVGNPAAVRAAAQACARNAAALFVPCHRVLRSDGTLGGFRWGTDVKAALLAHERQYGVAG
jgi:methylated-DNA-[protein]-cysteine S-methyltransferase